MGEAPAEDLLALHREGRLAAEYPKVGALLADLPDAELERAGRLLARLDPDAVLGEHPSVPAVRVAVTGHGTLSGLIPPLTAELARHGLLLRPYVSDFDGYVTDLLDPSSALYASDPDLVLCVLDPMVVFDEVPVPWRPEDVERVMTEKVELLGKLAGVAADAGQATVVLNTLPLPRAFAAQLVDHRSRARLGSVWREANARLLRLADEHPAVVVLDLDPILAEGVPATDARLSTYAKAHLSPGLLARYAREAGHLARHLTGRTRKCLVLDLDETLWGGVLGDDGVEGIEVGADAGYRAAAFHTFQRAVKQLGSQGVLLAAVSKNDPEPVQEALRGHPGMVLREDDFVQVTANWRPKHDNIANLAEAINLGVDAFVFADDSAFERGLVRRELPGVAVVPLDHREPASHLERLLADGWFDVREVTAEDRGRTALYRAESARSDFLRGFDSVADYLRELAVTVRLFPAGEPEVARISQLTLRTNQFNLTTQRRTPEEVRRLITVPSDLVLAVRAADRFGDNGLVGAVFLRRENDLLIIDNFLLSCRVFGRGIERACLAAVLRHARDTGAAAVVGAHRPTAKNGKVRDLYPRNGFVLESVDETETAVFRHPLREIAAPPEHVRLTETFERTG